MSHLSCNLFRWPSAVASVATLANEWRKDPQAKKDDCSPNALLVSVTSAFVTGAMLGQLYANPACLSKQITFGTIGGSALSTLVALAHIPTLKNGFCPKIPPNNPMQQVGDLDTGLVNAIQQDNAKLCRSLMLENNIDPNSVDPMQRTFLQIAIKGRHWRACKALIDNGANWTYQDWRTIRQYLHTQKVHSVSQPTFMKPFPTPGNLELYVRNNFHSLKDIPHSERPQDSRGVALVIIGDEEPRKEYGAIVDNFHEFSEYKKCAEHLTLTRARIVEEQQFYDVFDQVKRAFPNSPLRLVIFITHGVPGGASFTPNFYLSYDNTSFHNVVRSAIPVGGAIVMNACFAADYWLQKFSKAVPDRLVFGGPDEVLQMFPTFYYLPSSPDPKFLPYFRNQKTGLRLSPDQVMVYVNGEEIARGGPKDRVKEKIIQHFEPEAILPDETGPCDIDPPFSAHVKATIAIIAGLALSAIPHMLGKA